MALPGLAPVNGLGNELDEKGGNDRCDLRYCECVCVLKIAEVIYCKHDTAVEPEAGELAPGACPTAGQSTGE